MDREARQTAKRKIAAEPEFGRRCADAFYGRLFQKLPGAEALFTDPGRARRMFGLMIDLLTSTISDETALNTELDKLGRQHRMRGIQPMHLQFGRQAFLDAVAETCPALTVREVDLFGSMFDRMTAAMNGALPAR